ncbi:MAG: hypothetical protein U0930_00280 [Pirellulales bacterium]
MKKTIQDNEVDFVVWKDANVSRVVAFGDQTDAVSDKGVAIAFGQERVAAVNSPVGCAVTFGGGEANAHTAVSMLTSGGKACSSRIAVALNHQGTAIGREIAFADNLDSQAHSEQLAISTGARGQADGLVSIALGIEGTAVARAGGSIAIAFYDQHPGRWETAHGADSYWVDGEFFLRELRVAKVGEQGIRPDYVYRLDKEGVFVEVGPAEESMASSSR